MWNVPKKFTNRGQWQCNSDYEVNVSAPMGVIANSKDPNLLAAVARYAETKCLLGGVTSSQGTSLKGDNLDTYYRFATRVVDDPATRIFPELRRGYLI
jgi:5-methylthioadenosine/S-adenosylhomocysteine deaminase